MNWLSFLKKSSYIMLALMLGFASCSKNEDIAITEINPLDPDGASNNTTNNDNNTNTGTDTIVDTAVSGQITMNVGAADWTSVTANAQVTSNSIVVTGTDNDGETIALTLNDGIEGTYALSQLSLDGAVYSIDQTGTEIYTTTASPDAGGQVIITEIDTVNHDITGTFHLMLYKSSSEEMKIISNGVFTDIAY